LYRSFKRIFDGHNPDGLLNDLSEYSTLYSYIINGGGSGHASIDAELKDLNVMGLTSPLKKNLIFMRTKQGSKLRKR